MLAVGRTPRAEPLGRRTRHNEAAAANPSGPIRLEDLNVFAQKGSLFFARPTLNTYAAKHADLLAMAKYLFEVALSGAIKIVINRTYELQEAAQAHRDLPTRETIGPIVFHDLARRQ